MNGIRKVILAAVPIAVLAVAVSAVAQGGTVKVDSEVTIKEKESLKFTGKVKADNANCVEQREVVLKRVFSDGSSEKVGSDETDNDGKWKIIPEGSAGISMSELLRQGEEGGAGHGRNDLRLQEREVGDDQPGKRLALVGCEALDQRVGLVGGAGNEVADLVV